MIAFLNYCPGCSIILLACVITTDAGIYIYTVDLSTTVAYHIILAKTLYIPEKNGDPNLLYILT